MKYIDEQTLSNQEPHDKEFMVFTYATNDTNDVHTQIHAYIEELLLGLYYITYSWSCDHVWTNNISSFWQGEQKNQNFV